MQKKLKIITFFAVIFVITSLFIQYYSTTDTSIVSFRNYVQDISSILMGNTNIPDYQPVTTNVRIIEDNLERKNDFDYNAPLTEVDKKSIPQATPKQINTYEDRIRMESPEELDENGLYVALMQAVADNNIRRVQILIAKGARVNSPDGDTSFAPIFWAIDNGNVEMVKLLLSKGAKVNTPDDKGMFPIHWIVKSAAKRPNAYNMKPIFDAVLSAHPNEINRQDTKLKQTPIMFAVILGSKKAFAYLLDMGANVNIINWEKMNIANLAAANACHSCVYLIEEKERINRTTPLDNFSQTIPEPDPIWLPYAKKKSAAAKKKKTRSNPAQDQGDVIVITGSGGNIATPDYKDMPQILPLDEEDRPDIVMRSR